MSSPFRAGDVVHYTPAQHHCREGIAIAHDRYGKVVLLDTFWNCGGDQHALDTNEVLSAELIFNLGDYRELDQYNRASPVMWAKYAPADRQVITSQHGLTRRWFIRHGASEDWPTQIENARRELEQRELDAASAQRQVEWAREYLAKVITAATEAAPTQEGRSVCGLT